MLDTLGAITARISEIQDRLAALDGKPPAPALSSPNTSPVSSVPDGSAPAPTSSQALFSQALQNAGVPGATHPALSPSSVAAPPASLGPLPTAFPSGSGILPLPVAPEGKNVVPLIHTSAENYGGFVEKYAAQNGLDPALVRAVIQTESGGNPRSQSSAGAMGLMQLMPENVREAGIADPFDPEQNIAAGTRQLAGLLKQYGGNLDLALAGYNAGPGNVRKYGGVPPFSETRHYIQRVRAALEKG